MADAKDLASSSVHDHFDALIELLASDDAGDDSNFHIVPEGTTSTGLRDASGKLDYAKIRSLFSRRQGKNDVDVDPSPSSGPAPRHEPDSTMKLPQVSYESYGDSADTALTAP
jgi:hypothetical protein